MRWLRGKTKRFHHVFQHDSKDCGPTCLQMVHRHFGGHIPITHMRELCDLNIDGVSIEGLNRAAEELGFDALPCKISAANLETLPTPFISHWNQDHFVVVVSVENGKVRVADPALGLRNYSIDEFVKNWLGYREFGELKTVSNPNTAQGAVLLLEPGDEFKINRPKVQTLSTRLAKLSPYFAGTARDSVLIGLLFPLLLAITFALPFLMRRAIDEGVQISDFPAFVWFMTGYLTLLLSRNLFGAIRDILLMKFGARISIQILNNFISRLVHLTVSFFEKRSLGDLVQRQTDNQRIESFLTLQSLPTFFALLSFLVFAVVLALFNPLILLVYFAFSGGAISWISYFSRKRRALDFEQFEIDGVVQDNTIEIMSSVYDLKSFNIEQQKSKFYHSLLNRRFDVSVRAKYLDEYQRFGSVLFLDMAEVLTLVLAGLAAIQGQSSLGEFIAIMFILGQMRNPVERLVPFIQSAQDAWLSLQRLQALNEEAAEATNSPLDSTLRDQRNGAIILENVCFQYNRLHETEILSGLNFTIPPGKKTAIVGASGSGKSTLVKLLTKFHEPTKGCIKYAGIDLSGVSPGHWRQRIGQVYQDGIVFNTTLGYNITLSHADPDPARLERAIEVANVGEFLADFPMGLKTSIGRGGWLLSAGQKQRVLIARAIYRDPEILIFDEATSALDSENEDAISVNLSAAFADRTAIIIAHRLSTILDADQIVVLEKGSVVEVGTHPDLSKPGSRYFELFRTQIKPAK